MAYPVAVFEQEPSELRGRYYGGAQIINSSFAEGSLGKLREQVGICQRARLRFIRDNELNLRADFQSSEANADARAATVITHIAQEVTELSNADIWFMPSLAHWLYGLDRAAAVVAAMPVAYPMWDMADGPSLYKSMGVATTAKQVDAAGWPHADLRGNQHKVRAQLWNIAIFGDGGTYAGSAGAKPGPNRTTALGGDPLIDAIWAQGVSGTIAFLTAIGYGGAGKKIWLQFMNGPENSESLTIENFWDAGYFGNVVSDLKQAAGAAIATLCNVVAPTTATEGSAAARDTLYHQRMEWAVERMMAEIEAAFPAAANDVVLYQSMHEYPRKWRERFVGKYDSEIIDECNFTRLYSETRDGSNVNRDTNYLDDDFDQDRFFYIRVKAGVQAVLSTNGGLNTVTVAANATQAQMLAALKTLPGFGDGDEAIGDDVTVELHQGPGGSDTSLRDIGTQYDAAGGYATYGYHVRMGAISGASNSKSKLKEYGINITSHVPIADADHCTIFSWMPGGSADRGPGLRDWAKYKISRGVRVICPHAPVFSGTYADANWVYGPISTAGTYENARVAAGRARLGHVAGPMMEDEPYYHQWFWYEFGKMMEEQNP